MNVSRRNEDKSNDMNLSIPCLRVCGDRHPAVARISFPPSLGTIVALIDLDTSSRY
jgi:hypothetical protein